MVRNITDYNLKNLINTVLFDVKKNNDNDLLTNLFVAIFQMRDARGGKGERKLFLLSILHLYKSYPEKVLKILDFIPEYGYWKDFLLLLQKNCQI